MVSNLYRISAFFIACIVAVQCNIYVHNPRGSNNRLDNAGRDTRNPRRLFDSQNNRRGGYNVGSLKYYAGSELHIEWTNQHSCDTGNNNCDLILQYTCGDHLRDGSSESTIPDRNSSCLDENCNTDKRFGMHEDYWYYQRCRYRYRNKGLFTADKKLRDEAIYTRQNVRGHRYGYECPEEKDYYPYWEPTPWRDALIMTTDMSRCAYYQANSENDRGRWYCDVRIDVVKANSRRIKIPNNREDCEALEHDGTNIGTWKMHPSHGIPPPDCIDAPWSRDNHLGNGLGGYPNTYKWTVPDLDEKRCILRMRYNVTVKDFDGWTANRSNNAPTSNIPSKFKAFHQRLGFECNADADEQGYAIMTEPVVNIFKDEPKFKLELALDTGHMGRVFQDRSHTFAIMPRPSSSTGKKIHNLNVKGKRGNNQQVYPAGEYDFMPDVLHAHVGDLIHIQWTGSNSNPGNNAGQGRAGSDRSNLVMLRGPQYPEGSGDYSGPGKKYGQFGQNYPQHFNDTVFLGFGRELLNNLAVLTPGQYGGEMSLMDDAGTYFDLGMQPITEAGTYYYFCTRNNAFTNRDQKGVLVIHS